MSWPALPTSRVFVTHLLNTLASSSPSTSTTAPRDHHSAQAARSNPLAQAPEQTRKQLLSLHVLFPNEFVPALDLLDRRLVARFCVRLPPTTTTITATTAIPGREKGQEGGEEKEEEEEEETNTEHCTARHSAVYYVRSAQPRSSRYASSVETSSFYEVRLAAWNCSCPAFAFAAHPIASSAPPSLAPGLAPGLAPVPAPAPPPPPPPPAHSHDTLLSPIHNRGQTRGMEAEKEEEEKEEEKEEEEWLFGGLSWGNDMPPVCKHLLACVLVDKCGALFASFVDERLVSVEEAAGWAAGWGD